MAQPGQTSVCKGARDVARKATTRSGPPRGAAAGFAMLVVVSSAGAQDADPFHQRHVGLAPPPLRAVSPGVSDVERLARDLRNSTVDLRAPSSFERVYDLGNGQFARIDGGLVTTFPLSTYSADEGGIFATIPPGATFHIGLPAGLRSRMDLPFGDPNWRPSPASPFAGATSRPTIRPGSTSASELFPRAERRARPDPAPGHLPSAAAVTMFTSEEERVRIVRSLMERAREAAAGHGDN